MGVDTLCEFPGNVRLEHIKAVITKLLDLKDNEVNYRRSDFPEMIMIDIQNSRSFYYFFECNNGNGRELHLGRSLSSNISLGIKLVEFFGGKLIYQDCEPEKFHLVLDKTNKENCPQDDPEWSDIQQRINNLQPITSEFRQNCIKFAAYRE